MNAWRHFQNDFDAMTDEQVDEETQAAEDRIAEDESWVEAAYAWIAAGRPRTQKEGQ